jgi:hypothetical protein
MLASLFVSAVDIALIVAPKIPGASVLLSAMRLVRVRSEARAR